MTVASHRWAETGSHQINATADDTDSPGTFRASVVSVRRRLTHEDIVGKLTLTAHTAPTAMGAIGLAMTEARARLRGYLLEPHPRRNQTRVTPEGAA